VCVRVHVCVHIYVYIPDAFATRNEYEI